MFRHTAEYVVRIVQDGFRGFAARTDIWYAAISVVISGATGSKDKPVGALTPSEIAWYVLIAVVSYAALRIIFLAPYRLWKEQGNQIETLKGDLSAPSFYIKSGMAEHRVAAHKRLTQLIAEYVIVVRTKGKDSYGLHSKDEYNSMMREIIVLIERLRFDASFWNATKGFYLCIVDCLKHAEEIPKELKDKVFRNAQLALKYLHGD